MFPFITETWNPIAGGPCPHDCLYCWTKNLHKWPRIKKKYTGPWRLDEKTLRQKFKPGAFVFVEDMSDIGAPGIPEDIILEVFHRIDQFSQTRFLLLTKNPAFYNEYIWELPDNVTCGTTIETDIDEVAKSASLAPPPSKRINDLCWAGCNRDDLDYFVSIEPILTFSRHFPMNLLSLEPWAVAVGYDNYSHNLSEPSLIHITLLIETLKNFTTVYEKTIREAWWEE